MFKVARLEVGGEEGRRAALEGLTFLLYINEDLLFSFPFLSFILQKEKKNSKLPVAVRIDFDSWNERWRPAVTSTNWNSTRFGWRLGQHTYPKKKGKKGGQPNMRPNFENSPTWLSVVVTPPVTTVAAERAATGEAEADVVGVVPFKGFGAVLVASFTSWNFSMN